DNWRWSNKNTVQQISEIKVDDNNTATYIADVNGEEQKYSVGFYMDRVPTDKVLIDSLRSERNFANYQLGLIYKEKFKENLLAAGKLESVLRSDPEERLVIPTKYNLYKIYEEVQSPLASDMRYNIINSHPESR